MNINNINEFRNSKAYNEITDDPTYGGYMALARVICGVKTHEGYKRISMRDALNEVAYKDDTQVVDLCISKFFSEKPRVEVTIESI